MQMTLECHGQLPPRIGEVAFVLHPDAQRIPGTERTIKSPHSEDYQLATWRCPHCGFCFSHETAPLVPKKGV